MWLWSNVVFCFIQLRVKELHRQDSVADAWPDINGTIRSHRRSTIASVLTVLETHIWLSFAVRSRRLVAQWKWVRMRIKINAISFFIWEKWSGLFELCLSIESTREKCSVSWFPCIVRANWEWSNVKVLCFRDLGLTTDWQWIEVEWNPYRWSKRIF